MAEKETVWLAIKAALWPTKSVIHVSAFNTDPKFYYLNKTVIELKLTESNFIQLIDYVSNSLEKNNDGKLIQLGKFNKVSRYYLSKEKYHLFKTCNVWTAKALKTSGISINPTFCLTSKGVVKRLQRITN